MDALLPVIRSSPAPSFPDLRPSGPYAIRQLSLDDAPALLALRDFVLQRLEHPDLYVREDDELSFVRRHLGGHAASRGESLGVFEGDRMIAYAMLGLPDDDDPAHLGRLIDRSGRALGQVAHLASCMVHPGHRGHRLQRTLLGARLQLAQAHGRPLGVAMVSPLNHASRQNLLRGGLRIVHAGAVLGLQRQLLALDSEQPWSFDERQVHVVPCADIAAQARLTQAGRWGIASFTSLNGEMLVFARHLHAPPR